MSISTPFLISAPRLERKWVTHKAMHWAAISTDLTDGEYRLYNILRSLLVKNNDVRKLRLREICALLPAPSASGEVRSSSQSRVRGLLLSLGKKGLVTDPQGDPIRVSSAASAMDKELRVRVHDLPRDPAHHQGWRNTYDALDALRGKCPTVHDKDLVRDLAIDPSDGQGSDQIGQGSDHPGQGSAQPPLSDQQFSYPSYNSSSSPYLVPSGPPSGGEDEEEISDFVEEEHQHTPEGVHGLSEVLEGLQGSLGAPAVSEAAYAFVDAIPWPLHKEPSVSEREALAYEVSVRLSGWPEDALRGRLDAKCRWEKLHYPASVALKWIRDIEMSFAQTPAGARAAELEERRAQMQAKRYQQKADIEACGRCDNDGYHREVVWQDKKPVYGPHWCGHGEPGWENELWALNNPEESARRTTKAGCTNRSHVEVGVNPETGKCVLCERAERVEAKKVATGFEVGDSEGAMLMAQIRARKNR